MDAAAGSLMEQLVTELNVLLKLLDQETLSPATAEKKAAVIHLLRRLPSSVNGTDGIYMNTAFHGNGTRFVESLFEDFDCDFKDFGNTEKPEEQKRDSIVPSKSSLEDSPPPLPTTPPPEEYYEVADPIGPDCVPQSITPPSSSSLVNSVEDGYYEDAEEGYPPTQINCLHKGSEDDSDALSSSYESYDEDEDEAKVRQLSHRWTSGGKTAGPVKPCHVCAVLLRKRRFGQWTKQLTLIREDRLLCYKSSKDVTPCIDLPLNLCNVIYVPKDGRRKKHELRFSLPGSEALVLAVQSKEQAEGWLTVIREVSSQGNINYGMDGSISPMILRKMELDQVTVIEGLLHHYPEKLSADKQTTDPRGSSPRPAKDGREHAQPPSTLCKAKRGALSELTGTMSVAGRKFTRIINFPRKKAPLPRAAPPDEKNPRCGLLSVLTECGWEKRWCSLWAGSLQVRSGCVDSGPPVTVDLCGCEVSSGLDPKHPFAFRILRGGSEVITLEACSCEDMGRWLGLLLAETGCGADLDALRYEYVDLEAVSSVRDAARRSFLWATSTSSISVGSEMYDEVSYEEVQLEEQGRKPVAHGKLLSTDSSRHSNNSLQDTRNHGWNTNHCGKYGKTRAEEDARRYRCEEEALEKEKENIRNTLLSLRKEKRGVREELKSPAGRPQKLLEERLAQLEECCREKEGQRVDVELKLTEVKENLKKSLAGGMLGASVESRTTSKASTPQVERKKSESPNSNADLPVSNGSEIRKSALPVYASARGNVLQKAKEWEMKKGS
ncbi:LOW QUALITY PROTEIN: actin filament-associated protein 1-like 1 [Brienomyrus brachyistius]|uniref:LOW QUALITY PROTEIN: actin filament-associated protein 1-like 1 n=1 Tax=Brienomyrus brachyistius TaxID=42636 RepID=UPI0020B1BE36|nr:LOW QUALITY PROTEIN: actin filament-associated protein 1-like 1 [Brienomyrus brachyistius]